MKTKLFLLALSLLLPGCVTTPESGRRAFILTSEDEENHLGEEAYVDVLRKERLSTNARWTGILQRVGGRIAAAARQSGYQWEFKLIESKEKNAFCLPGGKVAFYTGIYSVADTEAGLATVMRHEVAHGTARHGGQRMTLALGTQLGLGALSAIIGGGESKEKRLLFGALGLGTTIGVALPFSRSNEAEADKIGLVYLARAGYDPHQAPLLWERFAKEGGGGGPAFLSTHPASADRMEALAAQVPQVMPEYQKSAKYGAGEKL